MFTRKEQGVVARGYVKLPNIEFLKPLMPALGDHANRSSPMIVGCSYSLSVIGSGTSAPTMKAKDESVFIPIIPLGATSNFSCIADITFFSFCVV